MLKISLDSVDLMNKKLTQVSAINLLLLAIFDENVRLKNDTLSQITWVMNDLLTDINAEMVKIGEKIG